MREKRARELMRSARKSEKQLRRFLSSQSQGLSEEELQAFTEQALAHAEDVQEEQAEPDDLLAKYGVGLYRIGRRKSS